MGGGHLRWDIMMDILVNDKAVNDKAAAATACIGLHQVQRMQDDPLAFIKANGQPSSLR